MNLVDASFAFSTLDATHPMATPNKLSNLHPSSSGETKPSSQTANAKPPSARLSQPAPFPMDISDSRVHTRSPEKPASNSVPLTQKQISATGRFLTSESPSPPRRKGSAAATDNETRLDVIPASASQLPKADELTATIPHVPNNATTSAPERAMPEPEDLGVRVSPTPSLPDAQEVFAISQGNHKPKPKPRPVKASSQPQPKQEDEDEDEIMEIVQQRIPSTSPGRKRPLSTAPSNIREPSTKRQRTPMRRRHDEFWALDGSVVLQFEDVMFRLHRSDLVRRSKYFADLLHSGEGAHEMVDGCPLYHVPGRAEDFECLWHAVEDAISFVHTPPPFPTLASILRTSTSLSFPSFRTWAVKSFEEMWSLNINSLTPDRKPHVTESIILARTCGVPNVLRHAFYELSREPSFGLADEGEGGGGEEEGKLERSDIARLVQLRTRLQADWISVIQMPPVSCDQQGCTSSRSEWFRKVCSGQVLEEGLMFDILGGLEMLGKMDLRDGGEGLCGACEARARSSWAKRRSKIWEGHLDLWLGLKGAEGEV